MAKELGQGQKDVGKDDLPYKVWLRNRRERLEKFFGSSLARELAILTIIAIAIIVLLALRGRANRRVTYVSTDGREAG